MQKQESALEETPTAPQIPPQPPPPRVYYIVQTPYLPPPPSGVVYSGPQYGPYTAQTYPLQPSAPQDAEMGQQPIPEGFGSSFDDAEVRRAFVSKVFSILALQLLLTAGIVATFMFVEPMNHFLKQYWWIIFVASGFMMIFLCTLTCCETRRIFPINYIVLTLFTIATAVAISGICVYYNVYVVLLALGITSLICCLVCMAACLCPVDITGCGCILLIALLAFLIFSVIAIVVQLFIGHLTILQIIIGAIGTTLFSLYLMYNIQLVMGGKKVEISPEEHVVAVVQLYLDIILIFEYVLMLVGILNRN